MKYALLAFAILWETTSTIITRCPATDGINLSTEPLKSVKFIPACIQETREIHKADKTFDKKPDADKYLKSNLKKFPNGQVVETR